MQPFKVTVESVDEFSKIWNYKGLAIPMDDIHREFAKDFANVTLRSFVELMQANAAAARKKAEEAAKPLVSLE